jgi:hypothetical protein
MRRANALMEYNGQGEKSLIPAQSFASRFNALSISIDLEMMNYEEIRRLH